MFSSRQFSFRSRRDFIEQLLLVYCGVAKWVDEDKVIDIAYLDNSKAFNMVCHESVSEKLVAYGFYSCLLSWVWEFLQDRLKKLSVARKHSQ